jgi:hypothetical protein
MNDTATNCRTCPQAIPASLEAASLEAASLEAVAAAADLHGPPCAGPCPKVSVQVTAGRVRVGSLNCYRGAVITICADKAARMVAAGHAQSLPPVY